MSSMVTVVGAGLAGSECALQLARRGIHVRLIEQRPCHPSPAHHTDGFAELVCSNSLKSTKPDSAAGLLKRVLDGMDYAALARIHGVPAPYLRTRYRRAKAKLAAILQEGEHDDL
mgnify:CR=1 FL=1